MFFDLPVLTSANRRDYLNFRKYLIKSGFIMMQESIYVKLVPNNEMAALAVDGIRRAKPPAGLVQILRITEKQFSKIEYVVGEHVSEILDTEERLVII